MNYRDTTVDIAKGLGSFLVVLGHVPIPIWLCTPIYLFHMPLFFLWHLQKDKNSDSSLSVLCCVWQRLQYVA